MKKVLYILLFLLASFTLASCEFITNIDTQQDNKESYVDPVTGEKVNYSYKVTEDKEEVTNTIYALANKKVDTTEYKKIAFTATSTLTEEKTNSKIDLKMEFAYSLNQSIELNTYADLIKALKASINIEMVAGGEEKESNETKEYDSKIDIYLDNGLIYFKFNLDDSIIEVISDLPDLAEYAKYINFIKQLNGSLFRIKLENYLDVDLNANIDVEVKNFLDLTINANENHSLLEVLSSLYKDKEYKDFVLEFKNGLTKTVNENNIKIEAVSNNQMTFSYTLNDVIDLNEIFNQINEYAEIGKYVDSSDFDTSKENNLTITNETKLVLDYAEMKVLEMNDTVSITSEYANATMTSKVIFDYETSPKTLQSSEKIKALEIPTFNFNSNE